MEEIEKNLWIKVRRYVPFLRIVPFLKMLAVCNNLAFGRADGRSDIDLFIIAKKNRLFIVRTFVTLILHLLGVRRHGRKASGRFCLSFFIDESALNLEPLAIESDIYLAYWIKTMKPVIDDGVSAHFLEHNPWIKNYFEPDVKFHFDGSQLMKKSGFCRVFQKFPEWLMKGAFGSFIEKILRNWQMKRALAKRNLLENDEGIVIRENILKFHNIDRRKEYRDFWVKKHGHLKKLSENDFLELV